MTREELIEKWPALQDVRCGVWIPNGWVKLVDGLMYDIYNLLGWARPDLKASVLKVEQVKEKFGALRFYYTVALPSSEEMQQLNEILRPIVHAVEEKSERTCEECGQPGSKVCPRNYLRTLCPGHALEFSKREL